MSKQLGLSDFLGHETKASGSGGTQFLRGWRKRSPAKVDVFLHRNSSIVALWQHNLPRVYDKELDDGSKQRRVFGGSWNCLEGEDVLRKQYRRDRDTGERIVPPVVCPVCRLMEHVRELYSEGEIAFTEELFRWEADDPKETQSLTLGGMLNMYGDKKLSPEQKAEMNRAGVRGSEAWKENVYAKCNYVFTVVDADNPNDGIQVAIETTSLGDHVKECIRNQMVSLGEDDGNPILNPYALRWEHHPEATEFNKKYKAIAMPRIKLTDEVDALISGDAPDIENIIKPGNITALRADLEAHYVGSKTLDWDYIFGPAERAGYGTDAAEEEQVEEEVEEEVEAKPEPKAEAAPVKRARRKKKEEPKPEPKVETAPCEECGFDMPVTASTCEKCGAEYELEAEEATAPASKPSGAKKKGITF